MLWHKTRKNRTCGAKNTLDNELGDCFTYIKPKFSAKIDQYLPRWSLYPNWLFSRLVLSIASSKNKVRVTEIRGKTYNLRYFYGYVWRTCAGRPSCRLGPPPPNRFYKLTLLHTIRTAHRPEMGKSKWNGVNPRRTFDFGGRSRRKIAQLTNGHALCHGI